MQGENIILKKQLTIQINRTLIWRNIKANTIQDSIFSTNNYICFQKELLSLPFKRYCALQTGLIMHALCCDGIIIGA